MQEWPFLLLRFVLCLKFNVYAELQIFFMLKNTVVSTLHVYRLVSGPIYVLFAPLKELYK